MSLSFSTICERMRAHAVYLGEGLRFPRATEAEIQTCEERLGFPLPPMLRELYTTVANGSDFFGPGYNFFTIFDDFARKHLNYPVLGETIGDGPRVFDDATVEALHAHPGAYVTCPHIPRGFVEFARLGCNVCAYLDGFTGQVYIRDDIYESDEWNGPTFSFGASSLEEWLERQLAEPPTRSSEGRYQPHYPLATALMNDENVAHGADEVSARSSQQEDDKPPIMSPYIRRSAAEVLRYKKRFQNRLVRAREEITQQIYDLDNVQRILVESGVKYRHDMDRLAEFKEAMQYLADVEAQLDKLLEMP